jgi:hypothetical protein
VLFGRSELGNPSFESEEVKLPVWQLQMARVVKRPADDVRGEWEQAVGVGASTSARLTKQSADWLLATSFLLCAILRDFAPFLLEYARSVVFGRKIVQLWHSTRFLQVRATQTPTEKIETG